MKQKKAKPAGGSSGDGAPPLRLEWRSPAELAENPRNWRRHPGEQLAALTDAIAEVGWAGACLYNEATGRLIDGHARRKVALDQGTEKIPVLVGSWTPEQEAKILATLDPLSAMATADADALEALLLEVTTESEALQDMLAGLAEEAGVVPPDVRPGAGGDDFDAGAALDGECRVKPGDMWLIDGDRHRLLCGDSTKAEDVARVMGGEKASAVVTDPPYPKEYDSVWEVLGLPAFDACLPDAFLVSFCGHYQLPRVVNAALAGGWEWFWLAVTANNNQPIMHGFSVKCCFKPCVVFRKGNPTVNRIWCDNFALRTRTADWDEAQAAHKWGQAASLFYEPIDAFTEPGDVLIDPFLGGGTTLLVAHRTGRRCCGVELDPRYAEVSLRRAEAEGLTVSRAG